MTAGNHPAETVQYSSVVDTAQTPQGAAIAQHACIVCTWVRFVSSAYTFIQGGVVRPSVLLLNWVSISEKQAYQLDAMNQLGYRVCILTNDYLGDSKRVVDGTAVSAEFHLAKPNPLGRIWQLSGLLRGRSRDSIAIVPPAGRFSLIALLMCRLARVGTICIEWGDIGNTESTSWLMRTNMVLCYRTADVVWYKEPFMELLLRTVRARSLFFLPNAVPAQEEMPNTSERDIDFLWANRFVPAQRRPGWFVKAATEISANVRCRALVLGYLDENRASPEVLQEQISVSGIAHPTVGLLNFTDPTQYYERSRFFVLASTHVYGNNAVMEAMARGVVPIVTCSPDVDLIVKTGWNGFVCDFNPDALREAMESALQLDFDAWTVLSRNARDHVRECYGVTEWKRGLKELLDGVTDRAKT